ncbi:hypothetical protein FPOA_06589 [Fusarium poae]|uniref:Uncharacterized protein n=1 Tax=Fusarium poae TaxID=36050 RepID=A0A1B8AI11_FUSPO|nr:hypothetical protein FPOA_06589 [Fusarium poae]
MTQKTWFLPPDFNLLPDGELRLGMIIKYPDRPTLALASLGPEETPSIALPEVTSLTETGHSHSTGSARSAGFNIFANFIDLASASGSTDISRYRDRSFGTVDHKVRSFSRALRPQALRAIVQLDEVKKFINGGPFGRFRKRPVYLVSGLRVAQDSFSVTNTTGSSSSAEANMSLSAAALGAPVPLETGGGVSASGEKHETRGYNTSPGIVFAYRLHVIRAKSDGNAESELFSDTTAFLTGEDEDEDEDGQEMELADVTGETVKQAKGVKSTVEEFVVGDEALVVFKSKPFILRSVSLS